MDDEKVCAEFILYSRNWDTIHAVIQGLTNRGFQSYEVGRGRISISASHSQYLERLSINLKPEGRAYVPAEAIVMPEDLKPYVQSISFSSSLKFF